MKAARLTLTSECVSLLAAKKAFRFGLRFRIDTN